MTAFADISHYQTVDLAAYQRGGYDRICMKATGGALDGTLRFADSTFAARWRQAGQLGLARVAYHFARNNNTGGDEFAWCWSQIQAAGGMTSRDVLCYDQEDNRPGMTVWAAQRAREFTAAAVRAGVTGGWIYSGCWYLNPAGLTAAMLPAGWRQLWISDYTAGQADAAIEVPSGWTRAQIVARQYTDNTSYPGIPAPCDGNRVLREWLETYDMTMDPDTKTYLDGQFTALKNAMQVTWYGDDKDDTKDLGTHPFNLQAIVTAQQAQARQLAALAGTVTALSGMIAAGTNDLTAAEVTAAVQEALDKSLVHVDISVAGQPTPPAA